MHRDTELSDLMTWVQSEDLINELLQVIAGSNNVKAVEVCSKTVHGRFFSIL